MTGVEAVNTLNEQRTDKHQFVRWWRKEEDFLDYDLIDRFVAQSLGTEEIGGLELLTMDDMWTAVKKATGKRLDLVHEPTGDKIRWSHKGKEEVCDFTPANIMAIFDAETRGNPVDS